MSRVLVTGASGFIGQHLCRRLAASGYRVTSFGRKPVSALAGIVDGHITGDITDNSIEPACLGQDIVFHLAGLVSYRDCDRKKQELVNVQGTKNVMNACLKAGVKRVIHTSSVAAMGIPDLDFPDKTVFADETFQYNARGLNLSYCDTKQDAEQVVLEYAALGLNVLTLSPGIIFGEGDSHPHHFAIFKSMSSGLLAVPGGGIPFSDIVDVVEAHLSAIEHGRAGERYVLVSANLTFMEAAAIFASIYGVRRPSFTLPPSLVRLGGLLLGKRQVALLSTHKIFFTSDKAKRELGFKPTAFEDTVRRTAPHYLHYK